jgi:hypothetical protein
MFQIKHNLQTEQKRSLCEYTADIRGHQQKIVPQSRIHYVPNKFRRKYLCQIQGIDPKYRITKENVHVAQADFEIILHKNVEVH